MNNVVRFPIKMRITKEDKQYFILILVYAFLHM